MAGGMRVPVRRGLALAGYALAALAIAFEEHRVGWLAIALLVASLLLRLLDRRRADEAESPDEPGE